MVFKLIVALGKWEEMLVGQVSILDVNEYVKCSGALKPKEVFTLHANTFSEEEMPFSITSELPDPSSRYSAVTKEVGKRARLRAGTRALFP